MTFTRTPRWAKVLLQQMQQLQKGINAIMTAVQIEQETLDADGDKLSALAVDLKSLIDGGTLPAASVAKLQAGLDALTSLDTIAVPPPTP